MCRMEKVPGHGLCPDLSGPGRPARSMHIPDLMQNFHFSPFPIWKSLIGRFSNRKWRPWGRSWWKWLFYLQEMRFALDRYGSRGHFLLENQSFIDFQIGNERKREFRAAEMRFYLHKEFCAAEIRFYLYKEFSRGTMWQKMAILQWGNSVCRVHICSDI